MQITICKYFSLPLIGINNIFATMHMMHCAACSLPLIGINNLAHALHALRHRRVSLPLIGINNTVGSQLFNPAYVLITPYRD